MEFLSLKQLTRRYLLEQQLLFLETEAEEAFRTGIQPGKDLGTTGPTSMREGGSGAAPRSVVSRGGASGKDRGQVLVGMTNPSFRGGSGSAAAGTEAGKITTSTPLGKSPAASPQQTRISRSLVVSGTGDGESTHMLELALAQAGTKGVGRARSAGRASGGAGGGDPRRRTAIREPGVTVSPVVSLELLETVRDRARIL